MGPDLMPAGVPFNFPEIRSLYYRLRDKATTRQAKMQDVMAVRDGRMRDVYAELFPDGPYSQGIVANMVDVAARDIAEVLAPLPAFNCASTAMTTDSQRKVAEKRTKIANGYISHSKVQIQMFKAADWYLSFGYVVGMVEADLDDKMPRIQFYSPMGAYGVKNRWGITQCVYMSKMWDRDELLAAYPEAKAFVQTNYSGGLTRIEVVRYHDKDNDILFLPQGGGFNLETARNPLGKCLARIIERPGVTDYPRGQFDDVLAVQVAKARFALLTLEAATKAVEAPIALPQDVVELNIGPDAVLRSATPEKIGRVPLNVPHEVFAQQAGMDTDLAKGSRYPGPRTGQVDGSIVTGRGVEALLSGFDTQIRTGQALFADAFTDLISLAFAMDEAIWPNEEKKLRGDLDGVKYELMYKPARDIKGEHTVDVQYGLMAGLDPNRALVFGLQARGDKLISRDFLRRQMPFAVNANEEEAKTDIEDLRESLKEFIQAYAQSLPAMVQQGMDPTSAITKIAQIIDGRSKGQTLESLVMEAFEPPAQEATETSEAGEGSPGVEAAQGAAGMSPDMGSGAAAPPGGDFGSEGQGLAGNAPMGSRPDVQSLLAGLTSAGAPNLRASISRTRTSG
jgi:hypothetical protein